MTSTANSTKTPEYPMVRIKPIAQKSEKTPSSIRNTCKHLIDACCKNWANMSDVDKCKHAKVINGMSKPYNSTLISVLKSLKEEPTLDKAKELLSMAEDLDGVHLDK